MSFQATDISTRLIDQLFYSRHAARVARDLLGCYLVKEEESRQLVGRITETEAYHGANDSACHGNWKKREHCEMLWGPPGHAYIYFTYGMHWMLNIVTYRSEFPSAVLVRAVEPVQGVGYMQRRRQTKDLRNLANGPAKLTQAFGITGALNGAALWRNGPLYVLKGIAPKQIRTSARVGIDYATQPWRSRLWRFSVLR